MIRRKKDMIRDYHEKGMTFEHIFYEEELLGKSSLVMRVTIAPGGSAENHAHVDDAEIYYVLAGEVVSVVDGEEFTLHEGDATFTHSGSVHNLENRTDKPTDVLAIVMK